MAVDGTRGPTDADLVASFRAGDTSALAGIYDRHADALHSFAVRTLGSPHDAADVVQDAFVLACQRMDQLRDPARLRPWLYAIVRNECTRVGRARARVVPVSPGQGPDHEPVGASAMAARAMESGATGAGALGSGAPGAGGLDADPVGTAAERAADVAVLHDALGGLDERDRVLFALQADRGLEGRDLADAAGIPARQLGQATARMRDRLELSIISLLVSRHGRRDCTDLGAILAAWDGQLTVLLRKRVSRHIDACGTCQARRTALVLPARSALAAPLLVIAAPADLRRRVLEQVTATGPSGSEGSDVTRPDVARLDGAQERWPGGFPPRAPHAPAGARRRALTGMAAAVIVVVALATLWAVSAGGASVDAVATGTVPSTTAGGPTTTTPGPTTSAPPEVPSGPAAPQAPAPTGPSADAPPSSDPTVPEASAPPADPTPSDVAPPPAPTPPDVELPPGPAPADPTTPDPSSPTPRTPPPSITSVRGPGALVRVGCPGATRGEVTATATGTRLTVVLLLEGIGAPTTVPMTADGESWAATVGPYDQPGTVTARVQATDDQGRTATSDPFSFRVLACAG